MHRILLFPAITSSTPVEGPVAGVTVTVKGTTIGTITDVDGKYTVSVPGSATTLVFYLCGDEKGRD